MLMTIISIIITITRVITDILSFNSKNYQILLIIVLLPTSSRLYHREAGLNPMMVIGGSSTIAKKANSRNSILRSVSEIRRNLESTLLSS